MHPSSEDTTQDHFQTYDSQNSDELFDPMKQTYKTYEDFVAAGSRHYSLIDMLKASTLPVRSYSDEGTTSNSIDGEATTLKPEDITTVYSPNVVNDVGSSAADDLSPQPLVDTSNASDLSSIKQAKMIVSQPVEHPEHLAQLHAENEDDEVAVVAMYSRNGTDDELDDSFDMDVDESKEEVPATVSPYAATTTTESISSNPMPIVPSTLTTTSNVPLATTTSTTIPTSTTTATTNAPIPTTITATTYSKKSKKIDTPTRFFKYSADEILRKYLEDIHIRAPLAALINTSPVALRKAKQLWKSTLRPNSPIDIVLVAFNSSGKTRKFTKS